MPSEDELLLYAGLCTTDDGPVPTMIHAILRRKITHVETATLSVFSAAKQSSSINLRKE